MLKRILIFTAALILSASHISCKRNLYKVSTRGSEVKIKIERLERDLFTISPGSLQDSIAYLKLKYGSFLKYFSYVIKIGSPEDSLWSEGLIRFCTDKLNNEVYGSIVAVFPEISDAEESVSDGFSHYKYYFPSKPIPAVFTCMTGFNNSVITGDSVLGISLDRYLGAECKYYMQLGLYKYQVAKMTPANLAPDCFYGWAASEWDFGFLNYPIDNVLTSMIHEGKLLYFVKCMLPETSDELIFGFSEKQLQFCRNNEGRMWEYLIDNNLLFNSEMLTKQKLTGDAPFTSYFSSESPGRAAVWLGFRIVESFMQKNRSVTLEELLKNTDVQAILEKAKYRPSPK